jgi:3',5'-cyclic AMP phosphodiesterase CpdA
MDDFTPFLQIVHISDLHVMDPKSPSAAGLRGSIRKLRRYFPWPSIIEAIEDGVSPHDPLAVRQFQKFLEGITSKESGWSHCETWMVDTGDLTSLGDQESLKLGSQFLSDLKKHCTRFASIYGNHDAWPGKLPAWATKSDIAAQKQALLTLNYNVDVPCLALRIAIPGGAGEVQLYLVDSVIHDRWRNLRALGEVSDLQLKALEQLVDSNYTQGKNHFRILGVHHPVHYPRPRSGVQMCMQNDSEVAKALDTTTVKGAYPLAHLVLSGHTHFLFPPHGKLPAQPQSCLHPDLGTNQCQFVVGTLMQLDRYNKRGKYPHQCEVLRFYYSQIEPSVLSVERFFVARQATDERGSGFGEYSFVEEGDKMEEEITFTM